MTASLSGSEHTKALGRRARPSALRRTAQRAPARENVRVAGGTPYEIWHTSDCPEWTVMQISLEAGSRRIKEQDAWAKELFPTVHERLKQAAETLPPDSPAQPFVDALTELVQAQADATGFVVLHR